MYRLQGLICITADLGAGLPGLARLHGMSEGGGRRVWRSGDGLTLAAEKRLKAKKGIETAHRQAIVSVDLCECTTHFWNWAFSRAGR